MKRVLALIDHLLGKVRLANRSRVTGPSALDVEAFEREIVRFALREENFDRFASILNEVLPVYVRWTWGRDGPYRRHFNEWQRNGFSLLPNHYYSPVPDVARLGASLNQRTEMHGIDLRVDMQLRFLREVCPRYQAEFAALSEHRTGVPHEFHFGNGTYERVDAELLHCMVRDLKPARMVEVGAGYSTLVSAAACRLNETIDRRPCRFTAIEPFPNDLFARSIPGLSELRRVPLQEVGLGLFEELDAGDILFIDSSHVLRIGSDVQLLFLEVLPRLRPGVMVHVHDIFLPAEYPEAWVRQEHVFWNEQYLLQAFLMFNASFEVVLAASYLHLEHPEELAKALPGYRPKRHNPGAFWMRRGTQV